MTTITMIRNALYTLAGSLLLGAIQSSAATPAIPDVTPGGEVAELTCNGDDGSITYPNFTRITVDLEEVTEAQIKAQIELHFFALFQCSPCTYKDKCGKNVNLTGLTWEAPVPTGNYPDEYVIRLKGTVTYGCDC
jgi:hypothetical protein